MHTRYAHLVVAGILALAVAACTGPTASPEPSAPSAQAFAEALRNAEYPLDLTVTGHARLEDGVFEEAVAPGSATKTMVRLADKMAFGDLDGDGLDDAAVTLVVDPGGSGTFTYLATVRNLDGGARPLSSVLLGDRVVVESIGVADGTVQVDLLTREQDEPMAAEPTVSVTRRFVLQSGALTELDARAP